MNMRLLLVVLVVANVASAIAVVHARHQHRQAFATLTRLEHVRDELYVRMRGARPVARAMPSCPGMNHATHRSSGQVSPAGRGR
mgnify:CR=1 FL=1